MIRRTIRTRRLFDLVTKRCIRTNPKWRASNPGYRLGHIRGKTAKRSDGDAKVSERRITSNVLASSGILSLTPSPEAPSFSLFLALLFGLPVALWSYKCLMMVLFQRKIIYMGYIPPGTRQEKLSDVPNLPTLQKSYHLEETRVQSSNRVTLSTLIMSKKSTEEPNCVILYLQGNAGNPLHRIPVFTSLLSSTTRLNPTILAPAPRSYWSSTNRTPTQRGLLADYTSALHYAAKRWPGIPIILYGHSLGGAVAICLAASLDIEEQEDEELRKSLRGMVLENPFASIPGMVHALYPQTWLPYRYLAPLAWDKWDALGAMRVCAASPSSFSERVSPLHSEAGSPRCQGILSQLARNMLVLVSAHDEVVPPSMGRAIFNARPPRIRVRDDGDGGNGEDHARLVEIDGALHEDAWRQLQWRREIGRYLEDIVQMGR